MLKTIFVFWLGLGVIAIACGQDTKILPEYGDLLEIKESRKVYVYSEDLGSRDLILNELKKDGLLEVVGKPDNADFFIFYGSSFLDNGYTSFGGIFGGVFGSVTARNTSETGEYYVIRRGDKLDTGGNRPRILWGKQNLKVFRGNAFVKAKFPAKDVTRNFVKELLKARGTKK